MDSQATYKGSLSKEPSSPPAFRLLSETFILFLFYLLSHFILIKFLLLAHYRHPPPFLFQARVGVIINCACKFFFQGSQANTNIQVVEIWKKLRDVFTHVLNIIWRTVKRMSAIVQEDFSHWSTCWSHCHLSARKDQSNVFKSFSNNMLIFNSWKM